MAISANRNAPAGVEASTPVASVRPRRIPVRTCVACRTSGGKRGLLRVVRLPEGAGVALDPSGKRSGRGAYVCPTEACVTLALKRKQLERALKTPLTESVSQELRAAAAEHAESAAEVVTRGVEDGVTL